MACAIAGGADAADLSVRVAAGGAGVQDAVVAVGPADGASVATPTALPAVAAIDQRDLAFHPYVQLARPGGAAVFRNSDQTRHHVYSFSPVATFEMVLGPGEQSARIGLDGEGVVAVGCNIHDQMISWLYVSDAPWLAATGAGGEARFRDLPDGEYSVRIWHPRLAGRRGMVERRVVVDGPGAVVRLEVPVRLRPGVRPEPDPERADY